MRTNRNKLICSKEFAQEFIKKYFSLDEHTQKLELDFNRICPKNEWGIEDNVHYTAIDDNGIYFETNGFPEDIYFELSKQNPDEYLKFEFCSEHVQNGVGYVVLTNGQRYKEVFCEKNTPQEKKIWLDLTQESEEDYYRDLGIEIIHSKKEEVEMGE